MHGAGAAQGLAAAEFRAGQTKLVAQIQSKRHRGIAVKRPLLAVHAKSDHRSSPFMCRRRMYRAVGCVRNLAWARQRIQSLPRDDGLTDPSGVMHLAADQESRRCTRISAIPFHPCRPAFVQGADAQDYRRGSLPVRHT